MRTPSDEVGLCYKGLHRMTHDNIVLRNVGNKKPSIACRTCYNERLRIYMRNRRLSRAKTVLTTG